MAEKFKKVNLFILFGGDEPEVDGILAQHSGLREQPQDHDSSPGGAAAVITTEIFRDSPWAARGPWEHLRPGKTYPMEQQEYHNPPIFFRAQGFKL